MSTSEQLERLAYKLYWLQFDPYTQLDMGNSEPVWGVEIELDNGEIVKVDLATKNVGEAIDNAFAYRLFSYDKSGLCQRVAWESTKVWHQHLGI